MVYMSFNNSCSHAAICTLLEARGIKMEAVDLLHSMHAHLLMDDGFHTGAMVQSDDAYSLGLRAFDLCFVSHEVMNKEQLKDKALELMPCVLPMVLEGRKHAVILESWDEDELKILNMKRKDDASPEEYRFTEAEFIERISFPLPLGVIQEGALESFKVIEETEGNLHAYGERLQELQKELEGKVTPEALKDLRPLLLDLPDALEGLEKWHDLKEGFLTLQDQVVAMLKEKKEKASFSWKELFDLYAVYCERVLEEHRQLLATL